jgi:hypothetical protein
MNEVPRSPKLWKPRRMDPPALQDRHPVLDPQQGLPVTDLREQEPRPAAVARMSREQLRKRWNGGFGQAPWCAQLILKLDFFERAASAAADQ